MRARPLALLLALAVLLGLAAASPAAAPAAVVITHGPSGVTESADALFLFEFAGGEGDDEEDDDDGDDDDDGGDDDGGDDNRALAPKVRFECRLDGGKWKKCSSPASYKNLDDGRHHFEVRRRKKEGTRTERVWTVKRAVKPPRPPAPPAPPQPPAPPVPPRPPAPPAPPQPVPPAPPAPPRPDPTPTGPSAPPVPAVDPPAGGAGGPVAAPPRDVTAPTVSISPDAELSGTTAQFRFTADEPVAGFECSFGDAPFAPCTSPAAYRVDASGSYVLRVRATDLAGNRGTAAISAWTVVRAASPGAESRIDAAPAPPAATGAQARAIPMSPFPLVRLAGLVYRSSVKVTVLSVRAPVGARVAIICRGSSCPLRRSARLVAAKGRRTVQTVTFGRLRNVRLRAGTVLEVRVTRAGRIGKYVRFTFVKGRAPKRSDRCLAPGSATPSSCAS